MPLDLALRLTLLLVAVRGGLNGLEILGSARDYQAAGVFAWPARRLRLGWTQAGPLASFADVLLGSRSFLLLAAAQVFICFRLFAASLRPLHGAELGFLWCLLGLELISDFRNGAFGHDGSDRMHLVVLCSLAICLSFAGAAARGAGAIFIALQAMLAYFTSGAVKVVAPRWRDGRALPLVLSSENYGLPALGTWVGRHGRVSCLLGWSVIVFELAFPFAVLLGPRPTLLLLSAGLLFHLGVAAVMGLNSFVWSFAATYPAIYWLSVQLHSRLFHILR